MATSASNTVFGISEIGVQNADTGEVYGLLKVVGSASITGTQELIPLEGGIGVTWAVRAGKSSAEASISFAETPLTLFNGFGDNVKKNGTEVIADFVPTSTSIGVNMPENTIYKMFVTTGTNTGTLKITLKDILRKTEIVHDNQTNLSSISASLGGSGIDDIVRIVLPTGTTGTDYIGQHIYIIKTSGDAARNGIQIFQGTKTPPPLTLTIYAEQETEQGFNAVVIPRCYGMPISPKFESGTFVENEVALTLVFDQVMGGYYATVKFNQQD